jgi:hypothetical protein
MKGVCKKAGGWLRIGDGSALTSRLLVSVYLQQPQQEEDGQSMPRQTLTRTSRRILLTTSIWSVIIIVVIFFITYTVLLVSVDHPFHSVGDEDKAGHRVRLIGKGHGLRNGTKGGAALRFSSTSRKLQWDPRLYNDPGWDPLECKAGNLFVVAITSTPDHFSQRDEIRRTWCNVSALSKVAGASWQCFFLVGQTNDTGVRLRLSLEHQTYADILQGRYVDSYRNLTHKVMHALSWVSDSCVAPYVLKTDDDCFVNTVLFGHFLTRHNQQTTELYAGNVVMDMAKRKVIRSKGEKWAVSVEDYLPEYYPRFVSGNGYALSLDVVQRLVEECVYVRPFPNEDAYVGVVMERVEVRPTLSGRFSLASSGLRPCNFQYLFVVHGVSPADQSSMYSKMMTSRTECTNQEEIVTWF